MPVPALPTASRIKVILTVIVVELGERRGLKDTQAGRGRVFDLLHIDLSSRATGDCDDNEPIVACVFSYLPLPAGGYLLHFRGQILGEWERGRFNSKG